MPVRATKPTMLRAAKSLCYARPLEPYPGWRFDAAWDKADPALQKRREIWSYFESRKLDGPLVMDWHDGLRLRLHLGNDLSKQLFVGGCFEPNEFAFLSKMLRPGMTFVDVGANDGIYSLFASRRVGAAGQVWAFEPSRREFNRLKANLSLNRLANVHAFRVALSNHNGHAELVVAGYGHEGQNTLGAFIYPGVDLLRKERVRVRKLDDVAAERQLRRLDVMKVDAEGAACLVLEGAERLLREMRPLLLLEWSGPTLQAHGTRGQQLRARLQSLEYRLYGFDRETGLPAPAANGHWSDNIIAAPSEADLRC